MEKNALPVRRALSVIVAVHVMLSLLSSFVVFPILERTTGREIVYDEYDAIGWNLAQGYGFRSDHGEETVARGPVYPLFIAALYHLAGSHAYWAIQLAQSLLGGVSVWLTFLLARRLFDERIALLAALFIALHPLLIWFASRIYLESFATALFLATCLLIDRFIARRSWLMALAAAAGIALCVLTKQVFILCLPLVFILLIGARAGMLKALAWTSVVTLMVATMVAPWTMRNYQVSGRFIPVHATLGFSLLAGHYYAAMVTQSPLSFIPGNNRAIEMFDTVTSAAGLPQVHWPYRSLREELDLDSAATRWFAKHYAADPVEFCVICSIRFVQFWYLAATPIASALMIGLMLVGFYLAFVACFSRRFSYAVLFPAAILALFAVSHAQIIGGARYSIPVTPLLLILASAGLLELIDRRKKPAGGGA